MPKIDKHDHLIKRWLEGREALIPALQYEDHLGLSSDGVHTSGRLIWDRVVHEISAYDAPRRETSIISDFVQSEAIELVGRGRPFIDLGCGGGYAMRNKIVPMARALEPSRITLIDQSQDLLREAARAIGQELPGLEVDLRLGDFYAGGADTASNAFVTMLGISTGNIDIDLRSNSAPVDQFRRLLSRIFIYAKGGYAFFTFDQCLDETENAIRYSSTPLRHAHLNFLDWAVSEGRLSHSDRSGIYYHPRVKTWACDGVPIASAVIHRAIFARGSVTYHGERIAIREDEERTIDYSVKFSKKFVSDVVYSLGVKEVASWMSGSIVAMLVLCAAK